MDWDAPEIETLITSALSEDVGSGDVSVAATIPPSANVAARILARQDLVCAGLPLVERILSRLDADVSVELYAAEGQSVPGKTVLATVNGNAGAILTGEQTLLNLVSRLSGIATLVREYADKIEGTRAKIRDTRKTTSGMRSLEQYAIRMGGGAHHRSGLFDAMVLRHAHIVAAGGVKPALDQAHSHTSRLLNPPELTAYEATGTLPPSSGGFTSLPVQIEIRSEAELREAFSAGAESILLIDASPEFVAQMAACARGIRADCRVEVSGDIALQDARAHAEAGVDYLSPDALTAGVSWARLQLLVDSLEEK